MIIQLVRVFFIVSVIVMGITIFITPFESEALACAGVAHSRQCVRLVLILAASALDLGTLEQVTEKCSSFFTLPKSYAPGFILLTICENTKI